MSENRIHEIWESFLRLLKSHKNYVEFLHLSHIWYIQALLCEFLYCWLSQSLQAKSLYFAAHRIFQSGLWGFYQTAAIVLFIIGFPEVKRVALAVNQKVLQLKGSCLSFVHILQLSKVCQLVFSLYYPVIYVLYNNNLYCSSFTLED